MSENNGTSPAGESYFQRLILESMHPIDSCIDPGPTEPCGQDVYDAMELCPDMCAAFGIQTKEDADAFIRRVYPKDLWPEGLKNR